MRYGNAPPPASSAMIKQTTTIIHSHRTHVYPPFLQYHPQDSNTTSESVLLQRVESIVQGTHDGGVFTSRKWLIRRDETRRNATRRRDFATRTVLNTHIIVPFQIRPVTLYFSLVSHGENTNWPSNKIERTKETSCIEKGAMTQDTYRYIPAGTAQ
jgi:hypothetical protein